uniref:Uncharacterized protein n=1 Tax=Anopheles coluzzii TaxID=1518534 RepID=A0A8W7PIB8_ANOCL
MPQSSSASPRNRIARGSRVIVVPRNVRTLLELERQQPDALAALPAEHVREVHVLGGMPQPDAVGAGGPRSARHHRVQLRSDGREPAQLQVPLDHLDPVAGQDALGREPEPHHRLLDPVGGRFERRVKVLLQVGELFRMLDRSLVKQPGQHLQRIVKQCLEWALAAECLWAEQLQRQRGKAQQAARREHLRDGGLHLHVLAFVIVHQAGGGVD